MSGPAFPLALRLMFNSGRAVKNMGKAKREFRSLTSSLRSNVESFNRIGQGIRSLGIATAPLSFGLAAVTRVAGSFEQGMANVQGTLLAVDEEMLGITETTKRLGRTTIFTARQATQGAEQLAKAGFSTTNIMRALPGVLDLASATGIGLGEAATTVSSQLGAFGLAATEAGRVADVLGLASVRANTNITSLGESLKFSARIAPALGFKLEDVAAAIGTLGNAGIRGSIAGTAFTNFLAKLLDPSEKAIKMFGGREGIKNLFVETGKAGDGVAGKLRPMAAVIENVVRKADGLGDTADQAAFAMELFGNRGVTVLNAFRQQLAKTQVFSGAQFERIARGARLLGKNIEDFMLPDGSIPVIKALRFELEGAEGAISEIAKLRLNTLFGDLKILRSAFEGLAIEVGGIFTQGARPIVSEITSVIQQLGLAFRIGDQGGLTAVTGNDIGLINSDRDQFESILQFTLGLKKGFKQARDEAIGFFGDTKQFLKGVFGTDDPGVLGEKIALFGTRLALIGPLILAIGAAALIAGPILNAFVSTLLIAGSLPGIAKNMTKILGIGKGFKAIGKSLSQISLFFGGAGNAAEAFGHATRRVIMRMLLPLGLLNIGVTEFTDDLRAAFGPELETLGKFAVGLFEEMKDSVGGLFASMFGTSDVFLKKMELRLKIFVNSAQKLGRFLANALASPFKLAFLGIVKILDLIKDSDIVKAALERSGVNPAEFKRSIDKILNDKSFVDVFNTGDDLKEERRRLEEELRQIERGDRIQGPQIPPHIMEERGIKSASVGGGSQQINLKIDVTGKISGRDLNIIATQEKIIQSELDGNLVNPFTESRLLFGESLATIG